MAIVNRDKDASEQLQNLTAVITTTVAASAGQSFHVAQVPMPGYLKGVFLAANSVSGSAQVAIDVKRWSGAGVTQIAYVGSTLVVTAHGISTAYSSQSIGVSSGFALQAGDVIVLNQLFSGGNVSAANMVVTCVVRASQDIAEHFGLTS